jgi:uncharacterized spore protein YtfJ
MNTPEVLDDLRSSIGAKRVYGEPVHEDGVTVIPAAAVRGGGGAGSDESGGGGVGFGIAGSPKGAWIVKDGEVAWKPAVDVTRVLVLGELTAMVGLVAWRSVRVAQSRRRTVTLRPSIQVPLRLLTVRDRLRLPWQEKPKPKFSLRTKLPF